MSVVLRLQGLSNRASAHDIRKFFVNLDIPQGGVTITGGANGEAFVDVPTWDVAYQALQMSGQQIRNSIIDISVASPEEKQQALENCTKEKESEHGSNGTQRKTDTTARVVKPRNAQSRDRTLYLRVQISDYEATESDIKHYFDGLDICGMTFSKDEDSPRKIDSIVKFGKYADAYEGFHRFRNNKVISVMCSNEIEWVKFGGKVDYDDRECLSTTSEHSTRGANSRSPWKYSKSPRRRSRSPRRRSRSPRKRSRSPQRRSRSPRRRSRSQQKRSRSPRRRSRSPQKRSRSPRRRSPRKRSRSPRSSNKTSAKDSRSSQSHSDEHDSKNTNKYYVQILNLSSSVEKSDVKSLFNDVEIEIVLQSDDKDHRKKVGLITFTSEEHYKKALELDKVLFKGSVLYLLPISKSSMKNLLSRSRFHVYLYVKNFALDVSKRDVKELFDCSALDDDDIFLLFDKSGTTLGEAVVRFTSLQETTKVERLHGRLFKDRRITMKRIYPDSFAEFMHSNALYLKAVDLNEFVTHEDDLSDEEEVAQVNTHEEEEDTPEVDSMKKEENIPECIAEADESPSS
ncbi:RNA-binding protein 12B-B-like [Hyperolius riggenbachi]|uniref:RNA-binding protein 12B-B-like n=1 Tax=Hyperolius riggenbachi TaxID=752182 RepID=UPI0035A37896